MNCKNGDMAIIVKAKKNKDYLGRIVLVKEWVETDQGPGWEVEPPLVGFAAVHDSALRPIRDQPGEDETLTWAGLPASHKETA